MPNYCSCKLEVSGNKDELAKFISTMNGTFSFNQIIPMPEELTKIHNGYATIKVNGVDKQVRSWMEEDDGNGNCVRVPVPAELAKRLINTYGTTSWYNWAISNWGTKWDAGDVRVDVGKDQANIWFETAWSPPRAYLEKVSEIFGLKFSIHFAEGGSCFWGTYVYENGVCVSERVSDQFWKEKPAGMSEDHWYGMEEEDRIVEECLNHIHKYGIGTGG